jgi:beta-lactamase regulating signal transducer with metallopeptidase domain
MFSIDVALQWLATTAGICFVILAIGALLTSCWVRAIERLRCIQITFVVLVVACALQPLQILPQIALGWLQTGNNQVALAEVRPQAENTLNNTATAAHRQPLAQDNVRAEGMADLTPSSEAAGEIALAPSTAPGPTHPGRWLQATILIVFAIGAIGSIAAIGLGFSSLRTLRKRCVPAPAELAALLTEFPATGRHVELLVSPEIDVPLTYGVRTATIVFPASMLRVADLATLRNCLAHEMSHICKYDIAQWWALLALQPLLWCQPLYWVLRRELRLCQDQIADHFASDRAADFCSYAEILLKLARSRHSRQTGLVLTMNDGRSSVSRRIRMLVSANRHLTSVCRSWMVCMATAILAVIGGVLGTVNLGRAEASAPQAEKREIAKPRAAVDTKTEQAAKSETTTPATPDDSKKAVDKTAKQPDADPSVMGEELPDGSLKYSGTILDKSTKLPIHHAEVTVRRIITASWDRRTLEETKHTTDETGKYSFVIPPQQVTEKRLYIELDVDHPDYARKANFGYALAMIRKNAALGDPPFYAKVELDPGDPLTGRLVGPEGKPLGGVPIQAYSRRGGNDFSGDNYGSFFDTKSEADGSFRLRMTKGGTGVFWIVPENFAPKQIVSGAKVGDWGDIKLEEGVGLKGQVVDATGKPLAGVWVNLADRKSQEEIQMPVASSLRRSGQTDAEGRFEIGPMKPGQVELEVSTYPSEIRYRSRERKREELPAIFPRRQITIGDPGQELLLVRAVPHVQFEGQYFDAKGAKKSGGWDLHVTGRIDGGFYFGQLRPNADGKIQGILPHGMEKGEIDVISNEHGAIRVRMGKEKPLIGGRDIPLGTIESDITDVEIIRYTAPIVQLKAVDEQGNAVQGAKFAGLYESEGNRTFHPVGGMQTNMSFEKQPNGVVRTSQMLPDEKTKFVASAEGCQDAQETLTLAEGEQRELTLVLRRTAPAADVKVVPAAMEKPEK